MHDPHDDTRDSEDSVTHFERELSEALERSTDDQNGEDEPD